MLGPYTTVFFLILALGLFLFARWRAKQAPDPVRIRMFDYVWVQFLALLLALLMLAHLATLVVGHPVTGQGRPF